MKSTTALRTLLALAAAFALVPSAALADTPAVSGVRDVLKNGGALAGRQVVLEGFVTGVCHSGGRKAFLHDNNPDLPGILRVERTGEMKSFDQDLKGKTLVVAGTVRELRIDKAYLDAWEARAVTTHEHNKEEKDEDCSGDCNDSLPLQAAKKKIAALRAQLAKSEKGYISSIWIDGTSWEVKAAAE